jgi:uncharacterized protein
MEQKLALKILKACSKTLKQQGAKGLYLFGSTVKNQSHQESDVDLFIDYDASRKFSLLDLVDMRLFLESQLKTKVDLTTRAGLHPALRNAIQREAVRVF